MKSMLSSTLALPTPDAKEHPKLLPVLSVPADFLSYLAEQTKEKSNLIPGLFLPFFENPPLSSLFPLKKKKRKKTSNPAPFPSVNRAQQLGFQDILALLVLLRVLVRLVVFPADGFFALPAVDVTYHVLAGRHLALHGFGLRDVDDGVEEVGFSVLAAEVLRGKG